MRKIEKIRYEIDPFNRLIIPRFRSILDGTFKISKDNSLTYHIKKPSGPSIPQQIKLSGDWSLDKEHNFVFTLDKENNQRSGDKLTLQGEIIAAKADELVFSISTKGIDGKIHLYMLCLGGRWQADEVNRLKFLVTKESGLADALTFTGSWEVNRQNQIVYTYTKTRLKTKTKLTRTLAFKGYWDIAGKLRLLYSLIKELNSCFDFKVSLGKPAKRGLEYEIGIGSAPAKKKFTLFGEWKVDKNLGLLFEMPYEEGTIRRIVFGADCKLGKGYNLELKLKNNLHEDLGISLKLSRPIFKGAGEAFVRALKDGKEVSLMAGAGLRW